MSRLNGVFERGACGVTSDNVRFARLSEVAVILNVSKNKCEKLLQSEGWNWCVTSVAKGAPVLVDMEDVRKYAVKSKDAALVRLVSGWLTGDTKTRKALLEDAKHRNRLTKKSSGSSKPAKPSLQSLTRQKPSRQRSIQRTPRPSEPRDATKSNQE